MSRFSDHFKAEIFSDAFTRIFFAGPAGRTVAGTFVFGYPILKGIWFLFTLVASLFFNAGAFGWKKAGGRRKLALWNAGRKLRNEASKFGDRIAERSTAEWKTWSIAGDGYRFGPFELELKVHAFTGAVIAKATFENDVFEIDAEDFLRIAGTASNVPKFQDLAEFYKNLRTHWI